MDKAWSLGLGRFGQQERTQDGTVAGPVEVERGKHNWKIMNVKVKSADLVWPSGGQCLQAGNVDEWNGLEKTKHTRWGCRQVMSILRSAPE